MQSLQVVTRQGFKPTLPKKYGVDGEQSGASICWSVASLVFPMVTSVTRLGDILDFGQLFKAFGNN